MPIASLKLRNFKRHEQLDLDFDTGLVGLRGQNECGKSTVLHAIAYALFGARSLSQPLEEVVTWGAPVGSLSVELEGAIGGSAFRVKRSKAGAELELDGRLVTGQTEVTDAISRLLGASPTLAANLFFVSQNSIRGALSGGTKQTTQLIEQLADFELLDRIVEAITSQLPCGQIKMYDDRVEQARAALDSLGEPPPPPEEGFEAWAAHQDNLASELQFNLNEFQANISKFDKEELIPATRKMEKLRSLRMEYDQNTKQLNEVCNRIAAFPAMPHQPDQEKYLSLRAQRADIVKAQQEHGRKLAAYMAFKALSDDSDAMWDGSRADFERFIASNTKDRSEKYRQCTALPLQIEAAKAELLTGNCTVCGLNYDEISNVQALNAKTSEEISKLEEELAQAKAGLKSAQETERGITFVQGRDRAKQEFIRLYSEFLEVSDVSVPPVITWKATIPDAKAPEAGELSKTIEAMEKQQRAYEVAAADMRALEAQEDHLAKRGMELLDGLKDEAAITKEFEKAALKVTEFKAKAQQASAALEHTRSELERLSREYATAQRVYEADMRGRKAAVTALSTAIAQQREVGFNNGILKKVRGARPQIVDRLWAVVLAAVSHHFSKMRGVQSVITRQEGGFKVDGQPVEGLSGSTLDILGLAIRLALLKTFLPNVDFLILDEPAAACDDSRHVSMLGTIATANFVQTILVTHSDVADAYATQLVTL